MRATVNYQLKPASLNSSVRTKNSVREKSMRVLCMDKFSYCCLAVVFYLKTGLIGLVHTSSTVILNFWTNCEHCLF
jgi:hypothetical protein